MVIDLIVGCRPNFVKAAAICEATKKYPNVFIRLIHTGQHGGYMSDPFFEDLKLPEPILISSPRLSSNRERRFGAMISDLTTRFKSDRPDYVMVVGDTDSTAAAAIAAAKLALPIIHVEAGLRCGDRSMPEEINRILVDSVSNILYTTTSEARDQLIAESHKPSSVVFVGNVMIDTLYRFLPDALIKGTLEKLFPFITPEKSYAVLTIHRAENVDDPKKLRNILDIVSEVAEKIPVIFPIHPRVNPHNLNLKENIYPLYPQGYLQFLDIMYGADFVMTDSGGIQEETTALGIPCLTLRERTERPETVYAGTNNIVGTDRATVIDAASKLIGIDQLGPQETLKPDLWDGHAADRLMADLVGGEN